MIMRILLLLGGFLTLSGRLQAQAVIFAELQGQPNMNTSGWNLTGAAQIGDTPGDADNFNNELILTTAVNNTSGAAFFAQPIDMSICDRWIASFEFRIFDGTAADGIAFCFLDVPPTGFVNGGGVGIPATANGLKVVFDTWDNGCGANPELQVYSGAGYGECFTNMFKIQNTAGQLNFFRSNTYNAVEIIYDSGYIDIKINNILWASGVLAPAAFTGYVGFTASTGGATDLHSIRNVQIYTDGSDLQGFLGFDTTGRWPRTSAACNGYRLGLKTLGRFKCNTLEAGASDFRLYNPNGQLMQLRSATALGCVDGRSDSILLETTVPFQQNGTYYLVSRQGVDGNVIEGDCGSALAAFDTVLVEVGDCYAYTQPVDMRNLSLLPNDADLLLHWAYPNTLNPNYFEGYSLQYQAAPGGDWTEWGRFTQITDTVTAVSAHDPQGQSRDFRVVLQLNPIPNCLPGQALGNILLEDVDGHLQLTEPAAANIRWSSYARAWSPMLYRLVQKNDDGSDSVVLVTTADTLFAYTKPKKAGWYRLEVNCLAPDGRWARSNAIRFEVIPRELKAFNVVTPNGDGKNDVFRIENVEFYPGNALQVFNRWGQQVFAASNYGNDWSPTDLIEGTYQYRLSLPDGEVLSGTFKLLR